MVVLFALLLILVDQGTKFMLLGDAIGNDGIAFGIAGHHNPLVPIFLGIGLVSSMYLYHTSVRSRSDQVLWGCIVGGIASNLIDRIRIGLVLDPFTLPWLGISLNIADIAISIGCVVVCFQLLARARAKQ